MEKHMKRNAVITNVYDPVADTLTFRVVGQADLVLRLGSVSDANLAYARRHGFIQRVSDSAAIGKNRTTGLAATPAEKREAMRALVDHYNSGADAWNIARVGGEGPGLDRLAVAAVMEALGKDEATVRAKVASGSEKRGVGPRVYLANLCTSDRVKPILTRMQAEASTIDADGELDSWDDEEGDGDEEVE